MRALEQNESDLRVILEAALASMTDAVAISDAEGNFVHFNTAFATVHRFRNKAECARTLSESIQILEVFFPDGTLAPIEMWAVPRALRGETATNVEYRLRRTDTGESWLGSYSFAPIRASDGTITGTVMVGRDVTEHKRFLETLREAEANYRSLFENASEGIFRSTPAGRLLAVNPALARAFGYGSPAEMIESVKQLQEHYADPSDRDNLVIMLDRFGSVSDHEIQIKRKDGTLRWISINAKAVPGSDGATAFYEGTLLDVTERREALEHIHHLNRVYAVLSDINQMIARTSDTESTLKAACEIAVRTGGFLVACITLCDNSGKSCVAAWSSPVLPEIGRLEAVCDVLRAPEAVQRLRVCNDILASDLSEPCKEAARERGFRSVGSFPLREEQKGIGAFILYSGDVNFFDDDETRLLEALAEDLSFAMQAHSREQRRQLAEQNLHQTEAQLFQAQKMETIGLLAGGVAHDFNNLLTVILMQTELMLMDRSGSAEVCEGLKEIRETAERAADLTRQLLLFGRRQVMQTRALDLNTVVNGLVKMLQRIIGEDISLELNLHGEPLVTQADAGMLEQVLMNLAVNSRDAMPGGGLLSISTAEKQVEEGELPELAPGRYACLRVRDTGPGIPPEVQGRVFEPFFTTKPVGSGTGLGLSTVFGIVKQHHGAIRLLSPGGGGTTFEVLLPLVECRPLGTAKNTFSARGGQETILLVEDDPTVRRLLKRSLQVSGYSVLEASHGTEALETLERHRGDVDLLLTDMVMPGGMSGLELSERVLETSPALPVLFVSGYSQDLAGRELVLKPGQGYAEKPVDLGKILHHVRSLLDERGARSS